ncbi:MAG: FAD-dependent oxidoreductase, partial [Clostridia bacterium]|nr:FAD-dependent oxidoreductase [Clostridia bacterium]
AVGLLPQNEPFKDVISLDSRGYASAGEDCKTAAKGIFVAGDCRTKRIRQVTTAAADGAVAALAACDYIDGKQ